MKLIDKSKEKLINSILYFCKNTKYLTQTKLYKLLYFLDFMHFRETGRSVTGLTYYAWEMGPVPKKLYLEIKQQKAPKEILECIRVHKDEGADETKMITFEKSREPNMRVFSEREKELLEKVAFIFQEAKAEHMVEVTHLKNQPWEKTIKTKGMKETIDYLLALDDNALISEDIARERLAVSNEMKLLFGNGK